MAKPRKKKINLAFQGGGAHGAVTWGVADRILEDPRLEIEAISGSSAGAINAAALAYGLHLGGGEAARDVLNALWKKVSDTGQFFSPVRQSPFNINPVKMDFLNAFSYQMFDTITRTFSPYQLNPFDINPLRDILTSCIDFESLRQCDTVKLYIAATNVRTGKVHAFETHDVSADSVCASACLPFLFKAVEIEGEFYWDGGYMGNPVLYPFFYGAKCADILIVHVNPIEREEIPVSAPDIMNRVNEISFNSSLLRELRAISFVHKLLDDGWLKEKYRDRLRDIRIHSIRSDKALVGLDVSSKFRTDWRFLTGLKERGREIADQWLKENFNNIGVKSSVNLREMFATDQEALSGVNN